MLNINNKHQFHQYITRNPQICGGEPIVHGTRVTIRTLLASLADGDSVAEILEDYPTVSEDAIWAIIAFAATSAQEDLTLMPRSTLIL